MKQKNLHEILMQHKQQTSFSGGQNKKTMIFSIVSQSTIIILNVLVFVKYVFYFLLNV